MIGLEGIQCLITRPLAESGGNTYSYEWSGGNPLSNYPEQKVGGGGRSLSVMNFTVMFVPKTQDSTLIDMLQKTENDLKVMTGWSTKLTEKPGVPLLSLLIKAFPVEDGCARGKDCKLCDCKGGRCMAKGVVYQATYKSCPKALTEGEDKGFSYIGETSRQVGTRVGEHIDNMKNWKKEPYPQPLDNITWSGIISTGV